MNVGDKVTVIKNSFHGHNVGTHGKVVSVERCGIDVYASVRGLDGDWEGLILDHLVRDLKLDESEGDK